MTRLGFFVLVAFATPAFAQDVNRKDLKPGLIAKFSENPDFAAWVTPHRLEPLPAVTLGTGESQHPRWPAFATTDWTGYLTIVTGGKYTFSATLQGWNASVTLSRGTERFAAVGPKIGSPDKPETVTGTEFQLAPGVYRIAVRLTSLNLAPKARQFELFWQGPGFRREPIPHYVLGHLEADRPARFADDAKDDRGRFLFEELSCKKCHAADYKGLTERTGPNLTEIGRRTYPGWLDAWLADPAKLRPHTTMPKMFADDDQGKAERYAVVAYLASLGGPMPEPRRVNADEIRNSVTAGGKLFFTAGCAACHGDQLTQPPQAKKNDDPDAVEKPLFKPNDYFYSLGTPEPKSLYLLGHIGSKTTAPALARYLENPLATNAHGRMPNMNLSSTEARDLARYMCRVTDDAIPQAMPPAPKLKPDAVAKLTNPKLTLAEQWKEAGKQLLSAKGCVNCHTTEPGGKALPMLAKAQTFVVPPVIDERYEGPDVKRGCLAEKPPTTVPVYKLDASQKAALGAFIRGGLLHGAPSPVYAARAAFKRFNCLACHVRDGEGGFSPELAEQMRLLEKAENADGVAPPLLTGAGHKLRTSWLKQVLTQSGRARPWMTLRMPQYGEANVGFLAEALPKLEGTTTDDTIGKATFSAANIEAGRVLTGKSGHGCISCHDISGVTGGGTRGPDLATTNQRVRYDWYLRWMHQPQRLAPGTRMPQTFIDGKALLTTYFNGDGDKQAEALWAYFSLGPGLLLPAGMEPPKGVVVTVKDRPEILRTFMPDNAGTKPIAVGYPGGASLVFDAATCRIAYAWSGNFLDASPVWNNRGGNPAKILGPKFWTGPGVFPWAVTDSRTPPDFLKRTSDPAYGYQLPEDRLYAGPRLVHFGGYELDTAGKPTFRYSLTDTGGTPQLAITEKPDPLPTTVAAGLKRTFTVEGAADKTVWLFVGATTQDARVGSVNGPMSSPKGISEMDAIGTRLVLPTDGAGVTVFDVTAAPAKTAWRFIPRPGGGWVALLRLPEAAGKAQLAISMWGLPRDEEGLLKGLGTK